MSDTPSIHASAVLIGARAALIRGPSGSGKSALALALVHALPFARLVADDRTHLSAHHGRLLVRPAETLAGLIEVRGLGVRRLPYEALAAVGLVVDLDGEGAARLPDAAEQETVIAGVRLPRLAVAHGADPAAAVLAWLHSRPGDI
jgi:serine kinase of HPr protein (carbohydrate metabolism regulator)